MVEAASSGYAYEDHTSDIVVKAWGPTLEEAFAKAGEAVVAIMTDPGRVEEKKHVDVEVEGKDLYNLLLRWIEEIIFYFDSQTLLFKRIDVKKIECREKRCRLKASMWGEEYKPDRHESRTHVKAATYSQMSIERKNGTWTLRFVVDI